MYHVTVDVASRSSIIANPPGVKMIAVPIQNPPYEDSAVAPKVLPTAISHIPARSWQRPPYANAAPITMFGSVSPRVPRFIADRTNVVKAKPQRPSGAGLPNLRLAFY